MPVIAWPYWLRRFCNQLNCDLMINRTGERGIIRGQLRIHHSFKGFAASIESKVLMDNWITRKRSKHCKKLAVFTGFRLSILSNSSGKRWTILNLNVFGPQKVIKQIEDKNEISAQKYFLVKEHIFLTELMQHVFVHLPSKQQDSSEIYYDSLD